MKKLFFAILSMAAIATACNKSNDTTPGNGDNNGGNNGNSSGKLITKIEEQVYYYDQTTPYEQDTLKFVYDDQNRIKEVTHGEGWITYEESFDFSVVGKLTVNSYDGYGPVQNLFALDNTGRAASFSGKIYDANWTEMNGTLQFKYDNNGYLASIERKGDAEASFSTMATYEYTNGDMNSPEPENYQITYYTDTPNRENLDINRVLDYGVFVPGMFELANITDLGLYGLMGKTSAHLIKSEGAGNNMANFSYTLDSDGYVTDAVEKVTLDNGGSPTLYQTIYYKIYHNE